MEVITVREVVTYKLYHVDCSRVHACVTCSKYAVPQALYLTRDKLIAESDLVHCCSRPLSCSTPRALSGEGDEEERNRLIYLTIAIV